MIELKIIGDTKEGLEASFEKIMAMFNAKEPWRVVSQEIEQGAGPLSLVLRVMIDAA